MVAATRAEVAATLSKLAVPQPARGATVVVDGPSGIGKTTLVASSAAAAAAAGVRVVGHTADERGARQPFASVAALLDAIGDDGADPADRAVAGIDAWCATGPVLLWIDDAEHVDTASVRVLARLWPATRDLPLSIVLALSPSTTRPDLDVLVEQATARLRVPALDDTAVLAMVTERLGDAPGPELRERLGVAGGNPFFLSVLLSLLQHRRGIHADTALPASAAAAVREQLRQLPEDAIDLLTTMAVLGMSAQPRDLAALLNRAVAGIARIMRPASEAGILAWNDDALAFRHATYRAVLLDDLPAELRRAIHRQAAEVLRSRGAPDAEIAEHMLRSGEPTAVPMLRRLAASAEPDAPGVAADLLADVVPLAPAAEADEVIADRVQALFLAGRGRDAEDLVRAHLPRTHDPATRGRMLGLSLRSLINRANTPVALAELANLLASPQLPPPARQELLTLRCWVLLLDGQLTVAERAAHELLDSAQDATTRAQLRKSLATTLAVAAWLHGRPVDALAISAEAETVVTDDPLDGRLSSLVWPPLFTLHAHGVAAARAASATARSLSAIRNTHWIMPFHDFISAGIAMVAGEWDDALADFDAALELARETGSGWISIAEGCRALIDVSRGQLDAARARLDAFARRGLPCQFGMDHPGLARLALIEAETVAAGRFDAAGDSAADAVAAQAATLWQDAVARGSELWLATIAPYVLRTADDALRRRMAHDMPRLAEGQIPGADPIPEYVLGTLAGDAARVRAAAQALTAVEAALEANFAWEEAALLAHASGDSIGARTAGRAALDGYERLGAESDVLRLRGRASSVGLRVGTAQTRRRPRSGWASLTPTEATIVELVREGLSNPAIARRLYLSPRTVQTHVSHILQKTELRSRVEIAAAAARG